ncbi:unnamed protein product [Dicrocoelium dendriticum]|nr:unnamed protein product [Dicrocoelium dendriticum]
MAHRASTRRAYVRHKQDGTPIIRYISLLNHLKQIAAQYDLQLVSAGLQSDDLSASSAWRLIAECFSIQINYARSPQPECGPVGTNEHNECVTITDVQFEYSHDQILPCPELLEELNSGNFGSLFRHVSNLVTVHAVPGNAVDRARAFMCLEAVEQDISMLSQVNRVQGPAIGRCETSLASLRRSSAGQHDGDAFAVRRMVNQSMVGHFLDRAGGRLGQLTYLITPAQAAVSQAVQPTEVPNGPSAPHQNSTTGPKTLGGYMARVGLRPRTPSTSSTLYPSPNFQHLAFMPLVTLHEDADGRRIPDFAQPDDIKCVAIEAELVLFLEPAIPMPADAIRELELITGLPNMDISKNGQEEQDLVQLILQRHGQKHLSQINTHLQLPNLTQHSYEIRSNVRGFLVDTVPFTCSSQLGAIIALLRKHASSAAFLESFVLHPKRPVEKDESLTYHFVVTLVSSDHLHVQFDHPCDLGRTVHVDILIGPFEVEKAFVNASRGEQTLNQLGHLPSLPDGKETGPMDSNLTDILARTHVLPIGLVWLLMKFGCPIHRMLPLRPTQTPSNCAESKPASTPLSKPIPNHKLFERLRNMLSQARSHVIIQGATGSGGLLSGADRLAPLDLDSPLLSTLSLTPGMTSAIKIPSLPPGVLAIPPPTFAHSETGNELVPGALQVTRNTDLSAKSRVSVAPASAVVSNFNPRTLRLDDLLIDNMLQQNLAAPQRSVNSSDPCLSSKLSTSISSSIGPSSSGKLGIGGQHFTSESSSPAPSSSVVSNQLSSYFPPKRQQPTCANSLPLSGTYNARIPAPGQFTTMPAICVPGTFAQSSLVMNSVPVTNRLNVSALNNSQIPSCPSTSSGSMLVNLLNEEPIPPSSSLVSHLSFNQRKHAPSIQSVPAIPGILDTSRESYAASAGVLPNRFGAPTSAPPSIAAASVNVTSSVSGGNSLPYVANFPTSTSPANVFPSLSKQPHSSQTVRHPLNVEGSTPTAPTKPRSATSLPSHTATNVGMVTPKKPRKRRRGASDCLVSGIHQRPGSLVSSTPRSVAQSSRQAHPSYHRGAFCPTTHPYGPVVNSLASSVASNFAATSSASTGRSVYDFDDTPGPLFEMTNSSSLSSHTAPTSVVSNSKLSSSGSSYSASSSSLLSSSGLTSTGLSSVGGSNPTLPVPERTVERKSSLKVTIKKLPPQPSISKSITDSAVAKSEHLRTVSESSSAEECKNKHGSGGQPAKRRKRRSVGGKPSAYMLQVLQHSSSAAPTSSNVGPFTSAVKQSKCGTAAVGHATMVVKKERKRRAGAVTEKSKKATSIVPPACTVPSNLADGQSALTSSIDPSKVIKLDRVVSNPARVSSNLSNLTPSTPTKSAARQSSPSNAKKKLSSINPVTSSSALAGASIDETIPSKRSISSLMIAVPHMSESKRKKSSEPMKSASSFHSVVSQHQHDADHRSLTPTDSGDLTPSAGSFGKLSRSVSSLEYRSDELGTSCYSKKSHTNKPFLSSATPTNATHGGLIKGYKIPKKKSVPTGPKVLLNDCHLHCSDIPSASVVADLTPNSSKLRPTVEILDSVSAPTASTLTPASIFDTSSSQSECAVELNSSAQLNPNQTNPLQLPPQQLPRRQPVKSISDIVDKLRAKSSGSSVTSAQFPIDSSSVPNPITPSEIDDRTASSVVGPHEISSEKEAAHDPRGDNIFEKFYTGTPTCQSEAVRTSSGSAILNISTDESLSAPASGTQSPLPTATGNQVTTPSTLSEDVSCNDDAVLTKEGSGQNTHDSRTHYELIKAQTDTPASPTESGQSNNTPTVSGSMSKIIPISPTSAKRLATSNSSMKSGTRHGVTGSLVSRKNLSSCGRFPRPPVGSVGPLQAHSTSGEGYTRSSIRGHPRSGRSSHSFPRNPHRSKNPRFASNPSWSSNTMEFGGHLGGQNDAMCGAPYPGALPPWMLSSNVLPPPGSGPSMPQFSDPHPPMPHHPYHSGGAPQRSMRPPSGFGPTGPNMYGTGR